MAVNVRIYDHTAHIGMSGHFDFKAHREFKDAYDSIESLFRAGMAFQRFNLESDLAYLQSRIANR